MILRVSQRRLTLKKLAEELVNLTVKDVTELADILKEEYGIEPAASAPVVAAAAGGEGSGRSYVNEGGRVYLQINGVSSWTVNAEP